MKVRMDRWVEEGRKESRRKCMDGGRKEEWKERGKGQKKEGEKEGREDRWKERGKGQKREGEKEGRKYRWMERDECVMNVSKDDMDGGEEKRRQEKKHG